ncbi:hypothetical protein CEXT_628421 [Caerostris extrusa]|uniref:Low-density lipoprotein receptor domain class A n=1 Tax=Caerostris extrusa TaxID=172846 RepID=A0AAV4M6I9_CAEEX|nr:hypothetical protein CEXT_628421 [Caerostris extrusa]
MSHTLSTMLFFPKRCAFPDFCRVYISVHQLTDGEREDGVECGLCSKQIKPVGRRAKVPSSISYPGKFMAWEGGSLLEMELLFSNCSPDEFKCDTGECIWKEFQCDGMLNCPDGSDEFGTTSKMCSNVTTIATKSMMYNRNYVRPTIKSSSLRSKAFNVTLLVFVISLVFILIFGVIIYTCYSCRNCHRNNRRSRRLPDPNSAHVRLLNQAIIKRINMRNKHQTLRFKNDCLPPPSYESLIRQNSMNDSCPNPPDYATVAGEGEILTDKENIDLNEKSSTDPPPPPPYTP